MRLHRFLILLCLGIFTVNIAKAQLVIEITSGADQLLPLSIVPFNYAGEGALTDDVAKIIEDDLKRSGFFETIPRENMLSFPYRKEDVFFRDWRLLKSDYVVIGSIIDADANNYEITFELLNVLTEQSVEKQAKIIVNKNDLRTGAHYVSDQVYQLLTGIRGAFNTRILYVTVDGDPKDPTYQLQVADADGHRPQVIAQSKEPILSPSWNSDGTSLTYVMFRNRRPGIFTQELATGKRQQLAQYPGLNGAPAWSPDGKKLAVVLSKDGNPEIYIFELETRKLTRVTNHYSIDTEPTWEPDGKGIIFTSDRGGNPQIYRIDINSKAVERITFEGDSNTRARMTPDGRYLVTVQKNAGNYHIALQDMNNGRVQILTQTYLDESPSIAPNGSMVIYATTHNGKGVLAVVSVDGLVKYRLPSAAGEVREPAWSPFFN